MCTNASGNKRATTIRAATATTAASTNDGYYGQYNDNVYGILSMGFCAAVCCAFNRWIRMIAFYYCYYCYDHKCALCSVHNTSVCSAFALKLM